MRCIFAACLILAVAGTSRSQEESPDLDTLKFRYEAGVAALKKPFEDLTAIYVKQLKALQAASQKSGNLEQVLAIRGEVNSMLNLELSGSSVGTFPELARLRGIYAGEKAKREQQKHAKHRKLLVQYKEGLDLLVQQLTREGNISEAKAIGAEIDRLAGLMASITPSSILAPDGVIPGVVRGFGKFRVTDVFPGLEKIDVTPLSKYSDFVEVKGLSFGFLARRANGDVLNHTGTVIARNIRRIIPWPENFLGIDGEGKTVVVLRGWVPEESQGITKATYGWGRGQFLRADGSLHWQGGVYTRDKDRRILPPLPARSNLKSITALGGRDFVLTNGGQVISWDHRSEVPLSQALQKGIVEMQATTYNVLFINQDHRILDHKGEFLKGPEIPARCTAILTGGEMAAFRDFNGHWSVRARRDPFLGEIEKLEHVINSRSTQDVSFHQRVGPKLDKDRAAFVLWIEAPPG